jgi:hypothetical protein
MGGLSFERASQRLAGARRADRPTLKAASARLTRILDASHLSARLRKFFSDVTCELVQAHRILFPVIQSPHCGIAGATLGSVPLLGGRAGEVFEVCTPQ